MLIFIEYDYLYTWKILISYELQGILLTQFNFYKYISNESLIIHLKYFF